MDIRFVTRGRARCIRQRRKGKGEKYGEEWLDLGGNNQLERKGEGVSVYT